MSPLFSPEGAPCHVSFREGAPCHPLPSQQGAPIPAVTSRPWASGCAASPRTPGPSLLSTRALGGAASSRLTALQKGRSLGVTEDRA